MAQNVEHLSFSTTPNPYNLELESKCRISKYLNFHNQNYIINNYLRFIYIISLEYFSKENKYVAE